MFIIIIKNRQVQAIVSTSHNLCVKPHNFVAVIYNSYLLFITSMPYISRLVFLQFRRFFCNTHRNATVLFCSPEGSRPVTHYLLRGQGEARHRGQGLSLNVLNGMFHCQPNWGCSPGWREKGFPGPGW